MMLLMALLCGARFALTVSFHAKRARVQGPFCGVLAPAWRQRLGLIDAAMQLMCAACNSLEVLVTALRVPAALPPHVLAAAAGATATGTVTAAAFATGGTNPLDGSAAGYYVYAHVALVVCCIWVGGLAAAALVLSMQGSWPLVHHLLQRALRRVHGPAHGSSSSGGSGGGVGSDRASESSGSGSALHEQSMRPLRVGQQ